MSFVLHEASSHTWDDSVDDDNSTFDRYDGEIYTNGPCIIT